MTKTILSTDNIHDFLDHQVKQVIFTDTETIKIFDTGEDHTSATVVARWTDGTKVEKLVIELVSKTVSEVAIDIKRIAVDDNYLDIDIQVGTSDDFVTLILTNNNALDNNTFRYYIVPNQL